MNDERESGNQHDDDVERKIMFWRLGRRQPTLGAQDWF